jgi:hypothetical protein
VGVGERERLHGDLVHGPTIPGSRPCGQAGIGPQR